MSIRSESAVKALRRFGELEWFKLPLEVNPRYGYHQVPYMGWRYTAPEERTAQYIEAAVKALPTQVEWTLDRSRRNWVILPTRILHEAGGLADPAFRDAVDLINKNDQDFCLVALEDFKMIIHKLREIPALKG
ncbi:hypothetical protein [Streptomyces sp. NPDC088766]|uniref:hypothetical protein n=1 Tax=Streptomyces sp. NPDC088766 TaxID=3365893 RepID=UPI0038175CB0